MEKNEILAKFIRIFPCFADQIQFASLILNTFGDSISIHLVSGDTLTFSVWGESWSLTKYVPIKNDIEAYNESGSTSGLTE